MDSVGDHGDEESIDSSISPRAAPVGKDCFSEPATSAVGGRGTPPRRRSVWTGVARAQLGLNSEATAELSRMNSFPGLLQSPPLRGTGPSPCGRAERHGSGEDTAATVGKSFRSHRNAGSAGSGDATATAGVSGSSAVAPVFGAAAAASGGTPRATVIPTGAGSSGDTPLFPATGLEEDKAANLEDEDQGFGLGYSMNFSSSDDEDETTSSDDEDKTLEIALNQLKMMQQYTAIAACMLACFNMVRMVGNFLTGSIICQYFIICLEMKEQRPWIQTVLQTVANV